MLSKRSSLLLAFLGGLAVGVGYPYVDIAIKCRVPISEACVWGKAFFSLTLTVSVVLVGGITAELAAKSAPDGYTLLFAGNTQMMTAE